MPAIHRAYRGTGSTFSVCVGFELAGLLIELRAWGGSGPASVSVMPTRIVMTAAQPGIEAGCDLKPTSLVYSPPNRS